MTSNAISQSQNDSTIRPIASLWSSILIATIASPTSQPSSRPAPSNSFSTSNPSAKEQVLTIRFGEWTASGNAKPSRRVPADHSVSSSGSPRITVLAFQ